MSGMHSQVGAMRICLGAGMVGAMQCTLCGTGRRDGVQMHDMHYTIMRRNGQQIEQQRANLVAMVAREYWAEMGSFGQKWAKRAENRGIAVILYDGFRKCFVNCKFTFYNTLS